MGRDGAKRPRSPLGSGGGGSLVSIWAWWDLALEGWEERNFKLRAEPLRTGREERDRGLVRSGEIHVYILVCHLMLDKNRAGSEAVGGDCNVLVVSQAARRVEDVADNVRERNDNNVWQGIPP